MIGYAMLALAGAAAAMPQAVTSAIAPSASAPAGCSANYPGTFEISVVNVTNTASKKRAAVTISLANGVMTDSEGRTGYIAANNQFQFDGPVQAGAIYTAGWSVCGNNTLALGGSAIFYECLSGTFYNLYDESTGAQCSAIYIDVIGTGSGSAVSSAADGQATAGSATVAATQLSDGQIQATTATAVSQISDGQIQATTATAVSQISDGQIQATTGTAKPVTQISDGQIQATTAAVVSQISDGQIQATTAPLVSQISDGQIQATTAAVVSQISDGQIQATTATAKPVSQISDGQIQAATNGSSIATASPTVAKYTGGASLPTARAEIFGLAAGVLAMAML